MAYVKLWGTTWNLMAKEFKRTAAWSKCPQRANRELRASAVSQCGTPTPAVALPATEASPLALSGTPVSLYGIVYKPK